MKPILLMFSAVLAAAAVTARGPKLEYHGKLADAGGVERTGTFLLHFRLWDAVQGGKQVWKESCYVHAESGEFKALLGGKEPIPEAVLASAYRLSIETPAGTGWKAEALEPVKVIGGEAPAPGQAAAAPPVEPAPVKPAAASAAAGGSEETKTAPRHKVPKAAAKTASGEGADAGPTSAEVRRLEAEVEKSKLEARLARERVEALEQKLEKKAPESQASRIYVVRSGDTLRSISMKLYGSEEQWVELYRANDDRIQRGGELIPGQLLLVPRSGE